MKINFLVTFGLVFALISCKDKSPAPVCSDSGKFIMSLKNEKGKILYDTKYKEYRIHFSNDGSLEFNAVGSPCNLREEYKIEANIIFSAYFFEKTSRDSNDKAYSMAIREFEFY